MKDIELLIHEPQDEFNHQINATFEVYLLQVLQGVPKKSDTIEIILIVVKPFLTLLSVIIYGNALFKIEEVDVYATLGFA